VTTPAAAPSRRGGPSDETIYLYTFEEHVADLKAHIGRVQANAADLAMKLADQGKTEFARILLAHAHVHDASKWHGIEWEVLHTGPDVDTALLRKAVEQHQKVNLHHPEAWGHLSEMAPVYVAEMVCDWLARSQEMATDLRHWVRVTASQRFEFDRAAKQAAEVADFLDLLLPKKFARA
jgi:hypothetical protein